MRYDAFKQKDHLFCVPACLQAILERNEIISPSQERIFSSFISNESGVVLNSDSLNAFLENFELISSYTHHQLSFPELDFVIEEALKRNSDILVAYYFSEKNKHCSLLSRIDGGKLILQDPDKKIMETTFFRLSEQMPLDYQCGFYIISRIPSS